MTTGHQKFIEESVGELHTEIAKILSDPACPDSIARALGRLQEWINRYGTEEIYHCKADLMERIQQYGRESRDLQWLMAN